MDPPSVVFASVLLPPGPLTPILAPASRDCDVIVEGAAVPAKELTVQEPNVAMSTAALRPIAPGGTVILVKLAPPLSVLVVMPGMVIPPALIGWLMLTDLIRLTP